MLNIDFYVFGKDVAIKLLQSYLVVIEFWLVGIPSYIGRDFFNLSPKISARFVRIYNLNKKASGSWSWQLSKR